jgi:hypothetical protein
MYAKTVFSVAFRGVPGLTTPILCPSSTTAWHVSVSQELSSGVHAVARKLLHCLQTDHALRSKLIIIIIFIVLKI